MNRSWTMIIKMEQKQPFFSIIIPTYSRPEQLAACLQSLACLRYPGDCFEAIVVDDGSKIPLDAVISPFSDRLNIYLLTQPHSGPAKARNRGAAQAKGEYLAFTDDDCTPAPEWLQTMAARFAATPHHAIGGRTLTALPDNPYSTANQLLIEYLYAYYNADHSQPYFLASNNLALPTTCFNALGGFDTTYPLAAGEDRDLCDRWLHHGYRMTYAPEAIVYHAHTLTFRTFWWRHFSYGRGAFLFRQTRARRNQGHIRLEPLLFYLNLLCYPFSQKRSHRGLLLSKLLVVSQLAHTAGFLWEMMNQASDKIKYCKTINKF